MIVAMAFAFVVVWVGSPRVFVANTPQVNSNFIAFFRYLPQRVYAMIQYPTDSEKQKSLIETAQIEQRNGGDLEYRPVISGVSAAEDPNTKETIVKIDAGTKLEVSTVTLDDGRQVKIYTPVQ